MGGLDFNYYESLSGIEIVGMLILAIDWLDFNYYESLSGIEIEDSNAEGKPIKGISITTNPYQGLKSLP